MDPLTLFAALLPVFVDMGKAVVGRYFAPETFKPATIEQWMRMQEVELARFQAVSVAGGNNPSYPWVEAIVRLQRPVIGVVVLAVWAGIHVHRVASDAAVDTAAVDNAAAAVWFYLFGERTLSYARRSMR
jgi:hypothetical protein